MVTALVNDAITCVLRSLQATRLNCNDCQNYTGMRTAQHGNATAYIEGEGGEAALIATEADQPCESQELSK